MTEAPWMIIVAEVTKAVSQLSSGKAPGADAIPAEIYKAVGPVLIEKPTELFQSFWKQGSIPQQLKDASIVHLYKRKGNRQVCDNHRGISLLSIAGTILARVLLNRLVEKHWKLIWIYSNCLIQRVMYLATRSIFLVKKYGIARSETLETIVNFMKLLSNSR